MATTADFRNGLCIVFKDDLYTIVQFQHVKPGKGPAFVRTKLRNVKTGRILENTFTSGVKIDTARIERRPYQFLYKEGLPLRKCAVRRNTLCTCKPSCVVRVAKYTLSLYFLRRVFSIFNFVPQ